MAAEGLVWRVWQPSCCIHCPEHQCACGTRLAQPWSCPQVPPWFPQSPWGCNPGAGQAGLRPTHTEAGLKAHSARRADHWFHPDCG